MKNCRKFFVSMLLAIFIVLAAGCSGATETNAGLPEVRNNGTAIQWRYGSESEWQDLVMLSELTGAAGEKGADGKDGADGKNGIDGKTVEVRSADSYIQWRYTGGEWQDLVALADISGPSGQNGADGVNGKTPEFRVNENALQWRYTGEEIWLNLYDLSALKGLDGKDGINGIDGENGDKGDTGEKGDKGDKGDPGQNGVCSGWFYGIGYTQSTHLKDGAVTPRYQEKLNHGGLVSCNGTTFKLKKGHTYNVCVSGSVYAQTNDNSGNHSVRMTDGYDDRFCRELTLIEQADRGADILCFNRIYDLTGAENDVELKFSLEQGDYNTYLILFRCTVTITALD